MAVERCVIFFVAEAAIQTWRASCVDSETFTLGLPWRGLTEGCRQDRVR